MCIFAPVPRPFRAFVRSLSLLLHLRPLLTQPLPVLSATFPSALNFKFRATTVSAAAATTDFRVFPPAYVLSFVSVEAGLQHAAYTWPRAIYGAPVSGNPALLFMAPPGMYQN